MPFYACHIDVDIPLQIARQRLQVVVAKKPSFWKGVSGGCFRNQLRPLFFGTVSSESFKIRRNVGKNNSFLPHIRGRFAATQSGTQVDIIMFMNPLVVIFMMIWLGYIAHLAAASDSVESTFFLWILFVLGVIGPSVTFLVEARRARNLVSKALMHGSNTHSGESSVETLTPS
jgi:hypothetical protein